mmetsp:Transcript_19994/g.28501  ORF Transcript_19994/g.28501 Transcript_19994/m.28501 type:complete len:225 (-) Transcript_19994:834-1508(-)
MQTRRAKSKSIHHLSIVNFPQLEHLSTSRCYDFFQEKLACRHGFSHNPASLILRRTSKDAFFSDTKLFAILITNIIKIFISTTRHIHQQLGPLGKILGNFHRIGKSMSRLQCRDDALHTTQFKEGIDYLIICCSFILDTSNIFHPAVLRSNSRIIESRSTRVNSCWVTLIIKECVALHPMQHSGYPKSHCGRVITLTLVQSTACWFYSNQLYFFVIQESREQAQ